jgi:tol-pal system protein YbgF
MMRPRTRRFSLSSNPGSVALLSAAIVGLGGCASDLHARHAAPPTAMSVATAAGDVGLAFDRFMPPSFGDASPANAALTVATRPSLHIPAGPPPASPPPLPVVKMDPNSHSPFANGQEPPIRIGRKGPKAPPVSKRGQQPLSYSRIDARGNLLGTQGQVLYRAGLNSRAVDTQAPAEQADVIYDASHASPRQLVARSTQVPRIAGLNEPMPQDGQQMQGYAPLTGVQPLERPRLKQFQIRDYDLPDERDYNVRVDDYGRTRVAPQQGAAYGAAPQQDAAANYGAAPAGSPPAYGAHQNAPTYAPPTGVVETQRYAQTPATYEAPLAVAAPAPVQVIEEMPTTLEGVKQVTFKGSKERRVQRLYKRGMKDMKKSNYRLATGVFKKLLKRYPTHDLADNALYWMGEGAYARGDWLQAMTWFQDVILRYPEGNKLPDAMLKSALCYAKLGDTSYAVQMLTEVETLFSGLPVAEVARKRRSALSGGM